MNPVPCTSCFGLGWKFVGFNGLSTQIVWWDVEGQPYKEPCKNCAGRGVQYKDVQQY